MQITPPQPPQVDRPAPDRAPPERLDRALDAAVRALARRTRIPGFRPGKAPRPSWSGISVPASSSTRPSITSCRTPIARRSSRRTSSRWRTRTSRSSRPRRASRSSSRRRPVRPEVTLGDYKDFNFKPEIETIDDARVDQVVEELRDQNATLAAVEDRGAKDGDYAVISFVGTRDGQPFEGGTSERMPLILGQERLIPGFETNLVGLKVGDTTEFDITFPEDYPEPDIAGKAAHFSVELKELREKILPDLDDDFLASLGEFDSLDALRTDVKAGSRPTPSTALATRFADRIIEYAVANATVELPEVLIDQEVEVMHDEFKRSLARQGISEEAYLKAVEKTASTTCTPSSGRTPRSAPRPCSCSPRSPTPRASRYPMPTSRPRSPRVAERYAGDDPPDVVLRVRAGRAFIRSTSAEPGRRATHRRVARRPSRPSAAAAPRGRAGVGRRRRAQANAAIGATDPGTVIDDGDQSPVVDEPAAAS